MGDLDEQFKDIFSKPLWEGCDLGIQSIAEFFVGINEELAVSYRLTETSLENQFYWDLDKIFDAYNFSPSGMSNYYYFLLKKQAEYDRKGEGHVTPPVCMTE